MITGTDAPSFRISLSTDRASVATGHTIEFTRRIQAADCPADQKVTGMQIASRLRFDTPFQNEDGLNVRQQQLKA